MRAIGLIFRTSVAAGVIVPIAAATAPINLEAYICVLQQPCNNVSAVCWAPSHPWGHSNCQRCDGAAVQDLCQKSVMNGNCYSTGNQGCGNLITGGTCSAVGGSTVGTCTGGGMIVPPQSCSVPKC